MAYIVKLGTVPDCCGALVIHNLFKNAEPRVLSSWSKYDQDYYGIDQAYVDKWNKDNLSETEDQWKDRIKKAIQANLNAWIGQKSYMMIILNTKQKALEETVLSCGFEVLIPEMENSGGSKITTYIYWLKKDVKPQASILKRETA